MASTSIENLANAAERLRMVKAAERRFLKLSGLEQNLINPVVDRLAADLEVGLRTADDKRRGESLHRWQQLDDEE
jgi:hypothetical protein